MSDTLKQRILFQLGITGEDRITRSFTELASKVELVAIAYQAVSEVIILVSGAMNQLYDDSQRMTRQFDALRTDMSQFNKQTGGLINTSESLTSAIKLQEAGLTVTKEQMAALGVAAADLSRKLGEDPGQMTERFAALTQGVLTAGEEALVPFGITLSQTADKTLAAGEILDKYVEKFGNVEIKAENAKEKLASFKNTLGTIAAFEFDAIVDDITEAVFGLASGISETSEALSLWENDLIATNGALTEHFSALTDLDVILLAHNETVLTAVERGEDLYITEGRLIQQNEGVSRTTLDKAAAYIKLNKQLRENARIELEHKNRLAGIDKEIGAVRDQRGKWSKFSKIVGDFDTSTGTDDLNSMFDKAKELIPDMGGDQFQNMDLLTRAYALEAARANELDAFERAANESGGLTKKERLEKLMKRGNFATQFSGGLGSLPQGISKSDDFRMVTTADDFGLGAGDGEGVDRLFGGGSISSINDGLGLDSVANQRLELNQNMYHSLLGMERQYLAETNRMNERSNQQKSDSVIAMASTVGSTFSNMSKAFNQESESGFNAMKSMAYAGNIVETTLAATAAFRSVMQTVPFPFNVVAAPILAGSVAAMGAANGRKIRQQKFGTGGSASPASPKISFPSGGMGASGGGGGDSFVFMVNLNGNTIHKEMMDRNDLANQSGDRHFSTKAA